MSGGDVDYRTVGEMPKYCGSSMYCTSRKAVTALTVLIALQQGAMAHGIGLNENMTDSQTRIPLHFGAGRSLKLRLESIGNLVDSASISTWPQQSLDHGQEKKHNCLHWKDRGS